MTSFAPEKPSLWPVRYHAPHEIAARLPLAISCALLIGVTGAAQTPTKALLVLNKEDATLAIVDPATMKVVGRVPTGEGPHEIVVSSDGTAAFVSNYRFIGRTVSRSRRASSSSPPKPTR